MICSFTKIEEATQTDMNSEMLANQGSNDRPYMTFKPCVLYDLFFDFANEATDKLDNAGSVTITLLNEVRKAWRGRFRSRRPQNYASKLRSMKFLFVTLVSLTLLLNGCAAIMDGKYVSEKGKPSPFQAPEPDKYQIPSDPTMRR